MGRLFSWALGHKTLVILSSLAVVMFSAAGASRVQFRADYKAYFAKDNPSLLAYEAIQERFARQDNVLFVVTPAGGNVFDPDTLAAIQALTSQAWRLPFAKRVDSVTNFQFSRAAGDELRVSDLVIDPSVMTAEQLREVRAVALTEPTLVNWLVSENGDVTAVNVTLTMPDGKDSANLIRLMEAARALAAEFTAAHPSNEVRLLGLEPFNYAFWEARERDSKALVGLGFIIMILITAVLTRSAAAVLATFAVVVATVATAIGMAGWLGIETSPTTASAPLIILTLGVAHSVHLLIGYWDAQRGGLAGNAAISASLSANSFPIVLTTLTTAIGFLCLNFSDVPPFRNLGNIVAIGEIAAMFYSLWLLPVLIAVLRVRNAQPRSRYDGLLRGISARIVAAVVHRPRATVAIAAGITALLLIAGTRNELNDTFVDYFDTSTKIRQDAEYIRERLTGLDTIQYQLAAGASGGVAEPDFLQKVDQFAAWYRDQPEVVQVITYSDILKRINRNLHGDLPQWHRLPESRELASQYTLLYELGLPQGMDLTHLLDLDKSSTRIIVVLDKMSTRALHDIERRAQAWLEANAPSLRTKGSGPSLLFAELSTHNTATMLTGAVVALVLTSLILVITLRSGLLGIVSLVPNLVPVGMALGVWGLTFGQVNVSLAVSLSVTLGIVIDDTIHLLVKYRHARHVLGRSSADALRYTFDIVGPAIIATSLILIGGFLVLSLSHFAPNMQLGLFTSLTLAAALVCDFVLLPALLVLVFDPRSEEGAVAVPKLAE